MQIKQQLIRRLQSRVRSGPPMKLLKIEDHQACRVVKSKEMQRERGKGRQLMRGALVKVPLLNRNVKVSKMLGYATDEITL